MTRPYSEAYKQKMVKRLIGKDAVSAMELARDTGVRQQNLSRWLADARSLPVVTAKPTRQSWTVEQKGGIVAEAAKLDGDDLVAFLQREGVKLAELERWRLALEEGTTAPKAMTRRIRDLERELARKEKALAEAAALLVLKKKLRSLYPEDGDDDSDEGSET